MLAAVGGHTRLREGPHWTGPAERKYEDYRYWWEHTETNNQGANKAEGSARSTAHPPAN